VAHHLGLVEKVSAMAILFEIINDAAQPVIPRLDPEFRKWRLSCTCVINIWMLDQVQHDTFGASILENGHFPIHRAFSALPSWWEKLFTAGNGPVR
jgi:hypothetical protein